MARRYTDRDPTANIAIGNVERQRKAAAGPKRRGLIELYPDLFAGLLPNEARELLIAASRISGGTAVAQIRREHLEQARAERVEGQAAVIPEETV